MVQNPTGQVYGVSSLLRIELSDTVEVLEALGALMACGGTRVIDAYLSSPQLT